MGTPIPRARLPGICGVPMAPCQAHFSRRVVCHRLATQLFETGWQKAGSDGTAKSKTPYKSTLGLTSRDQLGPPQRFPKPKVASSSLAGTANKIRYFSNRYTERPEQSLLSVPSWSLFYSSPAAGRSAGEMTTVRRLKIARDGVGRFGELARIEREAFPNSVPAQFTDAKAEL
jgi:hypothetical protein